MKQKYNNDYPSVTKILDILAKPGLMSYFKNNTPEFLAEDSKKNLAIGSQIHQAIQKHIELSEMKFETDYPDEVKNGIKSFFLFKKENPEIRLQRAEIQVTSEKYKYNGTLDCLGTENKELILIDWKTSKCDVGTKKEKDKPVIYPEHEYQATAYVWAYNEQEKADIQKARIVVFAKDKISYNTIVICKDAMEKIFKQVFLPCLSIFNFQKKEGNNNGQNQWSGSNAGQGNSDTIETKRRHNFKSNELPAGF